VRQLRLCNQTTELRNRNSDRKIREATQLHGIRWSRAEGRTFEKKVDVTTA